MSSFDGIQFPRKEVAEFTLPIASLVLVCLPTKLADVVWANAGKYSTSMEHMGCLMVDVTNEYPWGEIVPTLSNIHLTGSHKLNLLGSPTQKLSA